MNIITFFFCNLLDNIRILKPKKEYAQRRTCECLHPAKILHINFKVISNKWKGHQSLYNDSIQSQNYPNWSHTVDARRKLAAQWDSVALQQITGLKFKRSLKIYYYFELQFLWRWIMSYQNLQKLPKLKNLLFQIFLRFYFFLKNEWFFCFHRKLPKTIIRPTHKI